MRFEQPDLLSLLEDTTTATQEGPGQCPSCGEHVDNVGGYAASLNHAFDHWGHPIDRDECTSMRLTRNHCLYVAEELAHLTVDGLECTRPLWSPCRAHGAQDARRAITTAQADQTRIRLLQDLHRDYDRASHVWRNHLDRLHHHLADHLDAAGIPLHYLTGDEP